MRHHVDAHVEGTEGLNNQGLRHGQRQDGLDQRHQGDNQLADPFGGIKRTGTAENGVHVLFACLITLGHGHRHGGPQRTRHGAGGAEESLDQVPESAAHIGAVGVDVDVLILPVPFGILQEGPWPPTISPNAMT